MEATLPPSFVLIGSPVLSACALEPLAEALLEASLGACIIDLAEVVPSADGWHAAHVEAAVHAIDAREGGNGPLVLVGYSGAGPLLPLIAMALSQRPAACVFLDAGIPRDGFSRLELMAEEVSTAFAESLRSSLHAGKPQPRWTDVQLAPLVPETLIRSSLLAGLRPRPLSYFAEPIPVPAEWAHVPCGYLQLSAGYDVPAHRASALGWPVIRVEGTHFSATTEPHGVADELQALWRHLAPDVSD